MGQIYIIYVDLQKIGLLFYRVLLTSSLTTKFKINASMKQMRVICEMDRVLCLKVYFVCCLICKQLNGRLQFGWILNRLRCYGFMSLLCRVTCVRPSAS